jgi:hypothetical protein
MAYMLFGYRCPVPQHSRLTIRHPPAPGLSHHEALADFGKPEKKYSTLLSSFSAAEAKAVAT